MVLEQESESEAGVFQCDGSGKDTGADEMTNGLGLVTDMRDSQRVKQYALVSELSNGFLFQEIMRGLLRGDDITLVPDKTRRPWLREKKEW